MGKINKRWRRGNSRHIITDPNVSLSGGDTSIGYIGRRGRILYEAVVNNFFSNPTFDLKKNPVNDPDVSYRDSMINGANIVKNPNLIDNMPRCSITATIVSDKAAWGDNKPEIFYPMFPHLTMPVKPGEKIWVIYETLVQSKSRRGYWISRISSNINVDDPNYTHLDREFLYRQVPIDTESAMSAGTGDSIFQEEDIYNFPSGGGGDSNKNTMPGDNPYNDIVSRSQSYIEQFNGEPVPRFSPRVGDLVFEGSNNTLISLGQDRPSLSGPEDESGEKGIGTIDIVVGRGQSDDTAPAGDPVELEKRAEDLDSYSETNKFPQFLGIDPNEGEGNPDFETDLSRLYVSMKTNGDENFGLSYTYSSEISEAPYIIAKSNEIRLVGRGSIRASSEAGAQIELMSTGEASLVGDRVFLGSPSYEHTGYGQSAVDDGHQHIVKGDSLLVAFQEFLEDWQTLSATIVGNNGYPIAGFNTAGEFEAIIKSLVDKIEDNCLSEDVHTS